MEVVLVKAQADESEGQILIVDTALAKKHTITMRKKAKLRQQKLITAEFHHLYLSFR